MHAKDRSPQVNNMLVVNRHFILSFLDYDERNTENCIRLTIKYYYCIPAKEIISDLTPFKGGSDLTGV